MNTVVGGDACFRHGESLGHDDWGSTTPDGWLLLNLRLIEAPTNAIDYVMTHELYHVSEPNHGPKFFALLTQVMPDWPKWKERLERVLA